MLAGSPRAPVGGRRRKGQAGILQAGIREPDGCRPTGKRYPLCLPGTRTVRAGSGRGNAENAEPLSIGLSVRERRQEMGLSQEDFADKAGIHRTYVSSIELGKVQVSIRIAAQLAEALEIPLSELWRDIERGQSGNRNG
jgi:DNA-binding XRE family transcriptional regulator